MHVRTATRLSVPIVTQHVTNAAINVATPASSRYVVVVVSSSALIVVCRVAGVNSGIVPLAMGMSFGAKVVTNPTVWNVRIGTTARSVTLRIVDGAIRNLILMIIAFSSAIVAKKSIVLHVGVYVSVRLAMAPPVKAAPIIAFVAKTNIVRIVWASSIVTLVAKWIVTMVTTK